MANLGENGIARSRDQVVEIVAALLIDKGPDNPSQYWAVAQEIAALVLGEPPRSVVVNRGLTPGVDPCRHCGKLHFGAGYACLYLCDRCFKDVRPEVEERCQCLL